MDGQVLSGGVLLSVGALLWVVYFMPIWMKRKQFSAAEKNALRIHRTLRILAETAEIPEEVRVEATARQALAHERMLEAAGRSQMAEHEAKLAEAKLAEQQAHAEAKAIQRRAKALKREVFFRSTGMRVTRTVVALVAAVALIGMVAGVVLALLNLGSIVFGLAAATFIVSVTALVALAPKTGRIVQAAERQTAPAVRARASIPTIANPERATPQRREQSATQAVSPRKPGEQPVATATSTANALEVQRAEQLLELARRQAERGQREQAQRSATAPAATRPAAAVQQRAPLRPGAPARSTSPRSQVSTNPASHSAAPGVSRESLKTMGVIGEIETGMPDLDAALNRRRNAS